MFEQVNELLGTHGKGKRGLEETLRDHTPQGLQISGVAPASSPRDPAIHTVALLRGAGLEIRAPSPIPYWHLTQ